MPDTSDGDVLRITTVLSYATDDIQNVYHMQYSGSDQDDADVMDAIALFFDTLYAAFNAHISQYISYDYIDFWNVTQNRPMGQAPWPAQTVGAGAADVAGLQLAPLALFATEAPKSQGRKYMPPPMESETNSGGYLTAGLVADILTYALNFVGTKAVGTGTGKYGNWSKAYTRFAPWISAAVNGLVKTQRRRSLGSGV